MSYAENEKLTLDGIPTTLAEGCVSYFSHTFNGYEYSGSFKECADISEKVLSALREDKVDQINLSEMRTCLFFYYRALRHGGEPDEIRVNSLLSLIRDRVMTKRFE